MKIICTTEREIKENTFCRREYCCAKFKKAAESKNEDGDDYCSTMRITNNEVKIKTHSHYDHGSIYSDINYCPWCGTKLIVEHVKVDNTGLPPKEPEKKPVPAKKKH